MISKTPFSFLMLLLLVTSCVTDEAEHEADKMLVSSQVFTTPIGDKDAYAVQFRLTSEERTYAQYIIQLNVGSEVWLDTINLEVPAGDTLETEVIFSESEVKESDLVELTIKGSPLEG